MKYDYLINEKINAYIYCDCGVYECVYLRKHDNGKYYLECTSCDTDFCIDDDNNNEFVEWYIGATIANKKIPTNLECWVKKGLEQGILKQDREWWKR